MTRILVVKDKGIVAGDIRTSLERLGYAVPGVASSGEEAIRKAAETARRPDPGLERTGGRHLIQNLSARGGDGCGLRMSGRSPCKQAATKLR